MKKLSILLLSLFVVLGLAACGGQEKEEKDVASVESSNETSDETANDTEEVEEESSEESKEFNEVIVDNDNLKATLINIEKVVDTSWDEEYYDIHIEIENKRDETIEVQAREVSIDGRMVDDLVFFSETVAGGKIADGTMTIQNYDGDLPEMEENIEFILHAFSFDDYDFEDDTDVLIELN